MSVTRIAHRYAQALLDLSIEQNVVDKVNADMVQLSNVCKESKDFANLLSSPVVDANKKSEIFTAIFESKVEKMSLEFMNLVLKNSRENVLPQIANGFVSLYKKKNNILDVTVISATTLDKATKDIIIAKIKASFDGTIDLIEKVDASLIGGFIVRIDDKQIDASVASQLSNLKNILLN
ncbi:MAG: ATP synthase F1 subunit delta [Crocinitomix sp.]|nr:ATP synthase F1 subunit delta [Crocinitomix sp.]